MEARQSPRTPTQSSHGLGPYQQECAAGVGIIACVHAFSYDTAKTVIVSVRPDYQNVNRDVHFNLKLRAYLGTIIACREANKDIIAERVFYAAVDLVRVMQIGGRRFPSIKNLLRPIGEDVLEEFLPSELILTVLGRQGYMKGLEDELAKLYKERSWMAIYRLVGFLGDLCEQQRCLDVLPQIIPDHKKWMAWNPNLQCIQLWHDRLQSPRQRDHIWQFLGLEGPDNSVRRVSTARHSPQMIRALRLPHQHPVVFEDSLNLLDLAIASGDLAVDLFIYSLVHHRPLNTLRLDQVRVCLAAGHDEGSRNDAAGKLIEFHQHTTPPLKPSELLEAFVSAHPFLKSFPELRGKLGIDNIEFATFIREALAVFQTELSTRICAFAMAFRESIWWFECWGSEYVANIQLFPDQFEMQSMIGRWERARGHSKQWHMEEIEIRIGFRQIPGHDATPPVEEDPLWDPRRKLDIDRDRLRLQVLAPLCTTAPDLATSCLKRCINEPDTFVGELPPNVYVVNGTLDSGNLQDKFPSDARVIENAGIATSGCVAVQNRHKGACGALSGPSRRPSKPVRPQGRENSTELQPVRGTVDGAGDGHDDGSMSRGRSSTLAATEGGGDRNDINSAMAYPSAQDFKKVLLSKYYERIVSELEIVDDRGGLGHGVLLDETSSDDRVFSSAPRDVSAADVEALHELLRKRYRSELGAYGEKQSPDPSVAEDLRKRSAAALEGIIEVVDDWNWSIHTPVWGTRESMDRYYLQNIVTAVEPLKSH
ncbi:hypothetical protein PG996_014126 [Apiospora saccharicola]|uniref:Uncharacterized protein n=1 Tax=Apiospora saccharicola TaxID=335842 RepID=A0ABR1THI4_9PEZI